MASNRLYLSPDELESLKKSLSYLKRHVGFVENMGIRWCLDQKMSLIESMLDVVGNRELVARGIFYTVLFPQPPEID